MSENMEALKRWTGTHTQTKLFDSDENELTHERVFEAVVHKKRVAVIGLTRTGDALGALYSPAVSKRGEWLMDGALSAFLLTSDGRRETPLRFPVKECYDYCAWVHFPHHAREGCVVQVWVGGVGGFALGDERSSGWCRNLAGVFDGVENTPGEEALHDGSLCCTRLIAVQLS